MESVFEYVRELFDSSHSYVYAIMSEIPLYLIEYAWLAVNRRVNMSYLVSQNAVVPKRRHSESEHSKFQELLKMSQLQRRMVKQVQVG
jgi:hypothetical protein